MFGLYFSFDSFKYINFNLKINLPLLLSEQTTVLGKVFELLKSYDTLTFTNKDTSCKVSHSLQRKASAPNISFRDYLRLSYIINSVDKTNLSSYKSPPPFRWRSTAVSQETYLTIRHFFLWLGELHSLSCPTKTLLFDKAQILVGE